MTDVYHRICNSIDLMLIYVEGKRLDLGQQLPDEAAIDLDPKGNHVLTLLHENYWTDPMDPTPSHHRTSVLAKMRDSVRPYAVVVDVIDEQWQKLLTFEESRVYLEADGSLPAMLVEIPTAEEVKR